jgi:hypothetical protein
MVMRGWAAPTYTPAQFRDLVYDPKVQAPICFDPEATRTVKPYYELRSKLGMEGKTPDQIAEAVQAAYVNTFVDAAKRAGVQHIVKFSGRESGAGFDAKRFRFTRMHEEIEVLNEGGHEGRSYEMTGPEALTMADVAQRISDAIGKTVRYVNVTDAERRQALLSAGASAYFAGALDEQARERRRCPKSRVYLDTHEHPWIGRTGHFDSGL